MSTKFYSLSHKCSDYRRKHFFYFSYRISRNWSHRQWILQNYKFEPNTIWIIRKNELWLETHRFIKGGLNYADYISRNR